MSKDLELELIRLGFEESDAVKIFGIEIMRGD